MVLVKRHNHNAFAALVRRHTDRFYSLAYRSLNSKDEAEDAVQETFLKLWNKPEIWNANRKTKFTTWFYKLIVNQCIDINKKKKPLNLAEDFEIEDTSDTPVELLEKELRNNKIEAAIQSLPERQKTALNLCFYEELSNQDAAKVMGVRTKALQSLIMRAKTTLRAVLKVEGE